MKKILIVFCCVFLLTFPFLSSAEEIISAESAFTDQRLNNARQLAESAIVAGYPFDQRLYICTGRYHADGDFQFEYQWLQSTEVIFSVSVASDGSIKVTYNDSYSLENYYDELRYKCEGLFRNWSIEDKAWFAAILPAHCELETFRVLREHPDWAAPEIHFAQPILMHQHGIPDEKAVQENAALQLAKDELARKHGVGLVTLNSYIVSTYYYLDQPTQPHWVFQFWNKSIKVDEIWLDAHTGEIIDIN